MTITDDLAQLINQGLSNQAIARQLHIATKTVRAARQHLGIAPSQHGHPQGLTLEQTWRQRTRPVDGGHMAWTGQHNSHGVPVLKHRGQRLSAYRIAFSIRTGRDPQGVVRPACGMQGCVAPHCMDDNATRQHNRQAMRDILRMPPRPNQCRRGHDQAVHGRLRGSNVHYCAACERQAAREGRAA